MIAELLLLTIVLIEDRGKVASYTYTYTIAIEALTSIIYLPVLVLNYVFSPENQQC